MAGFKPKLHVIWLKSSLMVSLLALASLFAQAALAGDLEWGGLFRVEGYRIDNPEMRDSLRREDNYGLTHLILRPKIIASDGITIYSQFDLFNNGLVPNSQMGAMWGDPVNNSGAPVPPSQSQNSNTLSHTNAPETINVTELYLTMNSEFGQLVVGRVPLQFGLGMTYSAGRGMFDHFYDTRDLVGYKVIFGNIYILPMVGAISGGTIDNSDSMLDYMIQAQYENPESDIEMGIFFALRHGGVQASDSPTNVGNPPVLGGPQSVNTTSINLKTINMYALRDTERFRLGMEASFITGETGVLDSAQNKVEWDGYGIATEFEYRPEASHWKWGLKAGIASGDDPNTPDKFEGYFFNRNYDVAMLLFNHPLGQADLFRTQMLTGPVRDNYGNINEPDVEALSNVIYLAPIARLTFNEHWEWDNSIITGWLNTQPMAGQTVGTDLGYEWDTTVTYTPRKGVAWVTQGGVLFPGTAWAGGPTGGDEYTHTITFGLGTKLAVTF